MISSRARRARRGPGGEVGARASERPGGEASGGAAVHRGWWLSQRVQALLEVRAARAVGVADRGRLRRAARGGVRAGGERGGAELHPGAVAAQRRLGHLSRSSEARTQANFKN